MARAQQSLQKIDVHQNMLSQLKPAQWLDLSDLSYMDISSNNMAGDVSFFLNFLPISTKQDCNQKPIGIGYLNFANNRFSGEIECHHTKPLFQQKTLQHLNGANNLITGPVPDWFDNALETINLANNKFTSIDQFIEQILDPRECTLQSVDITNNGECSRIRMCFSTM